MVQKAQKHIIKTIQNNNVLWIRLMFVSITGQMKKVEIPANRIKTILANKIMFDGSSIAGYTPIEASDLYLHPDVNTFQIRKAIDGSSQIAQMICDVYKTDGTPFMGDPRNVLKAELKRMKETTNFNTFNVGLEPEFFLLPCNESGKPIFKANDNIHYFDIKADDICARCRRVIAETLEPMGIHIEASHHEVAPNQNEIDFRFNNALTTADNIELFKDVAKNIAGRFNLCATFMPKPFNSVNGSGMHINQSLMENGKNVFYDKNTKDGLSKYAKEYVAGLLKHASGFTAITNATINSYKRLIPGFEAPVNIAWGLHNRTGLVRVPSDRGMATRLELRNADMSCNPYLALTATLASGLDGIKNKLTPPAPIEINLFKKTPAELKAHRIKHLPSHLSDALNKLQNDSVIDKALGAHVIRAYTQIKQQEILAFNSHVTEWEQKYYLDV